MTDSKQGQTLASGRILGKGFLTMLVLAIASKLKWTLSSGQR